MVFNFSINQPIQNIEVHDLATEQNVNISRQHKSKSETDISEKWITGKGLGWMKVKERQGTNTFQLESEKSRETDENWWQQLHRSSIKELKL